MLVPKPDGNGRICGDYKVTVNSALDVNQYPLPCPADLMASLTGGQKFSKIDLTSAYQQMALEEESRQYVTANTHRGLYRFTHLPLWHSIGPSLISEGYGLHLARSAKYNMLRTLTTSLLQGD